MEASEHLYYRTTIFDLLLPSFPVHSLLFLGSLLFCFLISEVYVVIEN